MAHLLFEDDDVSGLTPHDIAVISLPNAKFRERLNVV